MFLLEIPGDNPFPCLFQLLETARPPFAFKAAMAGGVFFTSYDSDTASPPSFPLLPPDYIGPTQINQDNLPTSRSAEQQAEFHRLPGVLLACNLTYS